MLEQVRNAGIVDATIFMHGREGRIENFDVVRSHVRIINGQLRKFYRLWCAQVEQVLLGNQWKALLKRCIKLRWN